MVTVDRVHYQGTHLALQLVHIALWGVLSLHEVVDDAPDKWLLEELLAEFDLFFADERL